MGLKGLIILIIVSCKPSIKSDQNGIERTEFLQ